MHLVHLEDDDADAELVKLVVRKEWPECHIVRVATKVAYEAALEAASPDLILSDNELPGFNGLSALKIAHERRPETPFIFLSGTIGEERAIEALRVGAADYVIKGASARLIPAIKSALQQSEERAAKRRVEDSLRDSQAQFQQIAESIDNFIVLIDAEGRCLYVNPAYRQMIGGRELPSDHCIFEYTHPADAARFGAFVRQARHLGVPITIEYRLLLPDGAVRHLEARAIMPGGREAEESTLLITGRDVTERRADEQRLHEQASLLSKARDAICLFSLDYIVTYWNESAERIFRRPASEVTGINARDSIFNGQRSQFDAAYAVTVSQGEWHGEFRFRQGEADETIIGSSWSLVNDVQGRPKSILCINVDVTLQRQLELERQRSQRLEGLGMLAGGIAHDLNNLLSPILLSVGTLRPLAEDEGIATVLDTMEESALHGAELVRQILLFARGDEGQRGEVDLGPLLEQLKGFLRASLRRSIELRVEHQSDLWPIHADTTQLKQVVLNLCLNARDAMPDGGTVRIAATNAEIARGERRGFHGEIPAGRYVCLSVIDEGTGIPPEVMERIFDPFFTTKELGKGTGLGLSTIVGIVQNHGGAIQVECPTRGTVFRIYLPAAEGGPKQAEPSAPVEAELRETNGEGILVIDDDPGIRFFTQRILDAHGYRVFTAPDGTLGLDLFARERGRIHVVLCDLTMPGMHGFEVLTRLVEEAPQLKLIVMSGQKYELPENLRGRVSDITKPIKPIALASAVQAAISGR